MASRIILFVINADKHRVILQLGMHCYYCSIKIFKRRYRIILFSRFSSKQFLYNFLFILSFYIQII